MLQKYGALYLENIICKEMHIISNNEYYGMTISISLIPYLMTLILISISDKGYYTQRKICDIYPHKKHSKIT